MAFTGGYGDERRIGVTGHMDLTAETAALVREAIRELLLGEGPGPLVGVSCLAAGADTIFAETVLEIGGELEVLLPSLDYRRSKVRPEHADAFDRLLEQAAFVRTLPFDTANRAAYAAAAEELLDGCELLVAVWDGASPAGEGGTAAVVEEASMRGIPVEIVWPPGAQRAD